MKVKGLPLDRDLAGVRATLVRAAAAARRLAEQTGTPFYVFEGGRVVDLNAGAPARPPAARRRAPRQA